MRSSLNVLPITDDYMIMNLEDLIVLFLDCQTTGANPQKGNVIEIGWARSDTFLCGEKPTRGMETYFVKPPCEQMIPKHIQAVTGICQDKIASGISAGDVWQKLVTTVEDIAQLDNMETCPVIIHYAKFEEPFLRDLHEHHGSRRDFPLNIICTHEIARRLFPALPRRGIRALAGYYGYSVQEQRRCCDHIAATAVIWRELIKSLKEEYTVNTFEQLVKWLKEMPIHVHFYRAYPMGARERRYLPDKPGVYRMLRSNGDVLYVGKATSIRKRVNSYFRKRVRHAEHILEMLSQAKKLDITETGSALEAAILESDEIKQYAPAYNIALKKRQRGIWFCTANFKEWNTTPSTTYTRGPFARKIPVQQLAAIKDMIKISVGKPAEDDLYAAFGIPQDYAPGVECVNQGFELFWKQHARILRDVPALYALNKLGKELWLKRTTEQEGEIDADDNEENETRGRVWRPETVAAMIEANVLKSTHELRRTRWLVWLTESSIAWEEVDNSSTRRTLLIFENGAPPGYQKRFNERQYNIDLMTLDRMRVVMSEMRKLVSSGNWVRVRFSPEIMLDGNKLVRILKWI